MGMVAGPKRGPKSEINVTPLVDVVLVLLIIFMVVTPMLHRGKDVELPRAAQVDEAEASADPLVLSVTLEREVWVDGDRYDGAGLDERLQRELAARPERKVLVKGDHRLSFGDVRRVMEAARRSGAKSVSLAVEELKER